MGKMQRVKGRAFEQKLARLFKSIWPEAHRGIQYRDGGKEAEDIAGTPIHVEASIGGESIWAKWHQALKDSEKSKKPPIVVKKRDREDPVVLMHLWMFGLLMQCILKNKSVDAVAQFTKVYEQEFGLLGEAQDLLSSL